MDTFENAVGFWREDGSFIGTVGRDFSDFAVVNGVLVAAVNNESDGLLVRMSDLTSVSVNTLTGSPAMFVAGLRRGLFANGDQLGLLLEDAGGTFATVVTGDPFPVDLTLPAAGSYEVLRDSADLVVRVAGGSELLRRNASSVAVLNITGTSGNDLVTVLNSGTPVDTPILFDGASSNDQFDGALTNGATTLIGGRGSDTLIGGTGDDIILAGSGGDSVAGGAGNDLVLGRSGNDTISGDNGNDTIRGGQGKDTLSGGFDADVLIGGGGPDLLIGKDGNDRLIGGPGKDQLDGDAGDDVLIGGAGPDDLAGGTGNDTLNGLFRDDTFNQTVGRDTLIGGQRPAPRPAPVSDRTTSLLLRTTADEPVEPGFAIPPPVPQSTSETDNVFADPLLPELLEL